MNAHQEKVYRARVHAEKKAMFRQFILEAREQRFPIRMRVAWTILFGPRPWRKA